MEVVGGIEPGAQAGGAARVEHVAAAAAVVGDEVEVVAADLDPLDVGGKAEAEHRPVHVRQLEDVLVGDDLGQRPVGRALGRHRAGADQVEVAVEADRAGGGAAAGVSSSSRASSSRVSQRPSIRASTVGSNLVTTANGVFASGGDRVDRPVDVGAEELAVEGDHLAVEPVQRPQPEVAVLGQLGEAEVAVEGAVEQGADRRGLEEDVRLALGVQIGTPHRLHMQRSDPALVEHGGSLPPG